MALGLAVALAFAAGARAFALASGSGNAASGFGARTIPLNEQQAAWFTNDAWTRSQKFSRFMLVTAASKGAATVTVSVKFAGGPLALRVVNAHGHALVPGPVKFDPNGHSRAFSFTFVAPHGTSACSNYSVEFRSITGDVVKVYSADAVASYHRPAGNTRTCQ